MRGMQDGSTAADQPLPLRSAVEEVLATRLARVTAPKVVVIARGMASDLRRWLAELRPEARLERVAGELAGSDLHVALASIGQMDLLVDRSGRVASPARTAQLIGYLPVGGVLVGQLGRTIRDGSESRRRSYLDRMSDRLDGAARVTLLDKHVIVVNGRERRAIIREEEAPSLFALRPQLGRVLISRPAQHVIARGRVTMTESDREQVIPREWTTPPLYLREYADVVSAPGQIVTSGNLVLPETFRRVVGHRLSNQWLESDRPRFAGAGGTVPPRAEPAPPGGMRRLAGSYFHLDNELRGHFGHTTTEVLAKLWGWQEAKKADPALKALLHANRRDTPAEWELDLLEAGGVPRGDVVYTRDPVRVERLIGATPMFGNPRYAHPDIVGVWRRIADRLEAAATVDVPDRIFIGRRLAKRACTNTSEVEALFGELGYTLIYPEDYSLADQVRLFRRARAIAGFAGSGMFGLMWAVEPKSVVLVSSDAYPARNEFLIAGLLGHEVAVAWSPAASVDPETGEKRRGIDAPFTFDRKRAEAFVREAAGRALR